MSLDLQVCLLDSNESCSLLELHSKVAQGKSMVIDLWHTKCVKCPAALSHLNDDVSNHDDIVFVACALSLGDGNKELVNDLISEWENLTHIFMEMDVKEMAKASFGFSQVPYYIVIDKNGSLVGHGDPKTIDYVNMLKQNIKTNNNENNTNTTNNSQPNHVFTLDEDF